MFRVRIFELKSGGYSLRLSRPVVGQSPSNISFCGSARSWLEPRAEFVQNTTAHDANVSISKEHNLDIRLNSRRQKDVVSIGPFCMGVGVLSVLQGRHHNNARSMRDILRWNTKN